MRAPARRREAERDTDPEDRGRRAVRRAVTARPGTSSSPRRHRPSPRDDGTDDVPPRPCRSRPGRMPAGAGGRRRAGGIRSAQTPPAEQDRDRARRHDAGAPPDDVQAESRHPRAPAHGEPRRCVSADALQRQPGRLRRGTWPRTPRAATASSPRPARGSAAAAGQPSHTYDNPWRGEAPGNHSRQSQFRQP